MRLLLWTTTPSVQNRTPTNRSALYLFWRWPGFNERIRWCTPVEGLEQRPIGEYMPNCPYDSGFFRCVPISSDLDDDLALRAPGLDVSQRFPGLLKREHLVDDWPDDPGFDQGRNLTQLLPLRAHEQE